MAGRYRWFVVFLLFAVTVVNYIDRSAISFAVHMIQSEYSLSSSQIGLILGAFGIGYIISTLFGGMAVDRFGAKRAYFVAVLAWAVSIGWTGAATGFLMLYAARTALGLAEGPSFPTTTSAITRWLPPQERATALGGALVAVPIALAIGAPLVTLLIGTFGWRAMFFVLAVASLVWLPFWLIFYANDPSESDRIGTQEAEHIARSGRDEPPAAQSPSGAHVWRALLTTPTLWANYWAYFVFGYYLFFFMTWLPEYLRKTYNLDLSSVGLVSFLPWATAAVLLIAFGRWSDAILKRTSSLRLARSYQIAGTQLVAALAIIPVALSSNIVVAVAGITVAVAASMAANAAYYAVIADLVPRVAGTAMGIMTIFFAASGFLAPVITGYALEITGDFRPAFWLITALAASSVIGIAVFHHPDRDAKRLGAEFK